MNGRPRAAAAAGLLALLICLAAVPGAAAFLPVGDNIVFTGLIEIEQHQIPCPDSQTVVDTAAGPGWAIYEHAYGAGCNFHHGTIYFPDPVEGFALRYRLPGPATSTYVEIVLQVGDEYVPHWGYVSGAGWQEIFIELQVPGGFHSVSTYAYADAPHGIHLDHWIGYPSLAIYPPWESLPAVPETFGCKTVLSDQNCKLLYDKWNEVNETYGPVVADALEQVDEAVGTVEKGVQEGLEAAEAACRSVFNRAVCNNIFGPRD
jgi:hypothetical protein